MSRTLTFLSLASGSSGNCYYLGLPDFGLLIDAGIGIRTIKKVLRDNQIDFEKIQALLVTHDHADHIKTVGCLGEKYHIPVYTTEAVHQGIASSRYVEETLGASRRVIEKEVPFLIGEFRITAFEVPHDSTDNVGYFIEAGPHAFTFATDVGHITETVGRYICRANHLILEANYDKDMLRDGVYPPFLKERVASPTGHLSNQECADFLATHYQPQLKDIWLCHLSRDNNHPELARKTIDDRLFQEGIRVGKDVHLSALKRSNPSERFDFEW
ncbi:MAG: MBL fold metallo-hydrolase [Tannerella sp.]|jgi:phosphoribosyl 1,2-cyclic phosphodiesterase|nr:MBL fold metallo-hydrolase [Tannerella sp.]